MEGNVLALLPSLELKPARQTTLTSTREHAVHCSTLRCQQNMGLKTGAANEDRSLSRRPSEVS